MMIVLHFRDSLFGFGTRTNGSVGSRFEKFEVRNYSLSQSLLVVSILSTNSNIFIIPKDQDLLKQYFHLFVQFFLIRLCMYLKFKFVRDRPTLYFATLYLEFDSLIENTKECTDYDLHMQCASIKESLIGKKMLHLIFLSILCSIF